MAVPLDGSDRFSMSGIRLLDLKGNHHTPNLWLQAYHKELCLDWCCSLCSINDLPQRVLPSHTRLFADDCLIIEKSVPKLTPINFKMRYRIENGSGLCPSIHSAMLERIGWEPSRWTPSEGPSHHYVWFGSQPCWHPSLRPHHTCAHIQKSWKRKVSCAIHTDFGGTSMLSSLIV